MAELSLGWKLWADISQFTSSMKKAKSEGETASRGVSTSFRELSKDANRLERDAMDVGAQFGILSKEFKKASAAAQEARGKIDSIRNSVKGDKGGGMFSKLTGELSGLSAGFLGVTAIGFGVVNLMKSSVESAGAQEIAERKLATALGYTSRELLNQAAARQRVTQFGDEETMEAQARLAMMGLEVNQIKKLIPLIQDMAAAKGMDLTQASDLVAKSIGSGTNALARYGIEITGAVGSAERLDTALIELNKKFGGQAEAIGSTGIMALKKWSNAWGDLKEQIGNEILPMLTQVANTMTRFLSRKTGRQRNEKYTKENFGWIGWAGSGQEQIDFYEKNQASFDLMEDQLDQISALNEDIANMRAGKVDMLKGNPNLDRIKAELDAEKKLNGEYDKEKQQLKELNALYSELGINQMGPEVPTMGQSIGNLAINKSPSLSAVSVNTGFTPGLTGVGQNATGGVQTSVDPVAETQKTVSAVSNILQTGLAPVFTNVFNSLGNLMVKFKEGFKDGLQEIIGAVADMASSVLSAIGAMVNDSYDNKMAKLDEWYNKEKAAIEGSTQNEAQKRSKIAKLDAEADKKRRELQYKQAKANKEIAIIQAVIAGALGIVNSLAQGGVVGIVMAAIVGALAAIQIGIIASQPLPALAQGGLAYAPTMAMVGDNPNAGADPEVIAPLSKLRDYMGGGGDAQLQAVVRGEDIYFMLERTGKRIDRWR